MPKKKLSNREEKLLVVDRLDGMKIQELAEKYGCSIGTVWNIIDAYGLSKARRKSNEHTQH